MDSRERLADRVEFRLLRKDEVALNMRGTGLSGLKPATKVGTPFTKRGEMCLGRLTGPVVVPGKADSSEMRRGLRVSIARH